MGSRNAPKQPGRPQQTPPAARSPRRSSSAQADPPAELEATRRELREALERETATSEVLTAISDSGRDLESMFERLLRTAAQICRADYGFLYQVWDARDITSVRVVASFNIPDDEVQRNREILEIGRRDVRTVRVERSLLSVESFREAARSIDRAVHVDRSQLANRVWLAGTTVHIPEIADDPDFALNPTYQRLSVRALLGVPMVRGDDIRGAITLTKKAPGPFDESAIKLVETYADQAMIAIENVRLFNETKEALEQQMAMGDVLKAISEAKSDTQPVFDTINEHVARLCHAPLSVIFLVEGAHLRMVAWSRDTQPAFIETVEREPPRIDRASASGRAVLERRTVHLPDALADPEYARVDLADAGGHRTTLAVPLVRDGVPIGILSAVRREVQPFTDREIQLVETFAAQAVIAIENVRLFNETREGLEHQTAIADVLRAISSSPSDLAPTFDTAMRHAATLCEADAGFFYMVDGHSVARTVASHQVTPQQIDSVSDVRPQTAEERQNIGWRVYESGRTVEIPDVQDDEHLRDRPVYREGGFRSLLGVPLLKDGKVIGVITLWRKRAGPFGPRQIELVQTFANQAIIAIDNVRLFQAVERQRQELTRFVSPQVAALLTSDEGQRLLEGHRRAITVLFCDLRGFSAFSETAEPEEVLGVLRDYHAAMGALIVAHGGTLEHFAGDGMMVFFNDPVAVADHELRAVRLAVAMRDCFAAMAQAWHRKGYELGFGIGAAVGHATLGRIGFEGRYDYGAIGNAVIIASRLSGEAKAGQILLTQRLHAAVEQHVDTEAIGELSLKGQTRPTAAFSVRSLRA